MILGMDLATFALVQVVLSLIGIATGLASILGLTGNRLYRGMTAVFLATTVLTSVTGFLFPFKGMTPGIILGILSTIALLTASIALYAVHLAGAWRATYVVSASLALYFNVFVLFAQLFGKVPALKVIAPTQASPAFGITQLVVLVGFIVLTRRAVKAFRG